MFEYISHYNEGYPFNNYIASIKRFQFTGLPRYQLSTKAMLSLQNYIELNQLPLISTWKLTKLRRNSRIFSITNMYTTKEQKKN